MDQAPAAPLIVASNRGPVSFNEGPGGGLEATRGAGGLVTALGAVMRGSAGTWLAAALTEGDREHARRHPAGADFEGMRIQFVDIGPETFDGYYNGTSNSVLWFMNHAMWNLPLTPVFDAISRQQWDDYRAVNRIFAQAIARRYESPRPGATGAEAPVMLQDYHLCLVAQYLKELHPRAFSYHFTHTPWTQPATMQVLPGRMAPDLLEGLLANDLLGFQSPRWSGNFLQCCEQILGAAVGGDRSTISYQGHTTSVRSYPITIDAGAVRAAASTPAAPEHLAWLEELLQGRRLVLRLDRLELSKNLLRGFLGFAQMLRAHPELRGTVVHLAMAYPSREALAEYRHYERQVMELAAGINRELGTADWQPIVFLKESNYPKAVTCCRRYDVLLVNPISDGMNLVAKEGPVVNEVDGVVVLSRTAGAWDELSSCTLGVNPYDVEELAGALYEGLTMPKARRREMAGRCRTTIEAGTVQDWIGDQLADIEALRE